VKRERERERESCTSKYFDQLRTMVPWYLPCRGLEVNTSLIPRAIYWEHPWGTHWEPQGNPFWELEGNMLGTKEK
jgi:hypothetical protein